VIFHLKERRTMGTLSLLKSSILEMKTKDLWKKVNDNESFWFVLHISQGRILYSKF
jgi:hypothetical protein